MGATSADVDQVTCIRVLVETGRYRYDRCLCWPRKDRASISHVLLCFSRIQPAAGLLTLSEPLLWDSRPRQGHIGCYQPSSKSVIAQHYG